MKRRGYILLCSMLIVGNAHGQQTAERLVEERPIDLPTALRLAHVDNPEIRLARQRVQEAMAYRQLAAAQFLPTLNVGANINHHIGPLQQSNGEVLKVNRDSLYLGMGAGAVSAGTVSIPGVVWSANISDVWYNALIRKQIVMQRQFESEAVRNDMLLRVASAYLELLRSAGRNAVAMQIRDAAAEVAKVTAAHAKAGEGRQADADRAATEYEQRKADFTQTEADVAIASARLGQLLRISPAIRLIPMERQVIPASIVPEPIPLSELLAIAITQRPELQERQAAIRAALLQLRSAKLLPFSPNVLVGFSAGRFGGGSDRLASGVTQADGSVLQQSRFGNYGDRTDFDAVMFWSLRNLGVGNVANIRVAQSQFRQSELLALATLDRIRAEVASAQARVLARYKQIELNEKAIESAQAAFKADLGRTRNRLGLPIELLDSLRLVARSKNGYLDAIVDYNRAQFELYVALGQPPADALARPVVMPDVKK